MQYPKTLFFLLIFSLTLSPARTQATDTPLVEPARLSLADLRAFIPKLQKGGYVIFIRHAATNHQQEDKRPVDLANCETQRNLTDKGKQQARIIGQAFRHHHIPIGQVFNSPYCRCRDTARLAFGQTNNRDELYFAMGLNREGKQARGSELAAMLKQAPGHGTNTVIVSHTANLQEATGFWPKPEGVTYIFTRDKTGRLDAIAIIEPDSWAMSLH